MSASGVPYEQLLAAVPGFFAHVTVDGKILFLNRLAEGYTLASIRDATVMEFTAPEYRDELRASLARVVATRLPTGFSSVAAGDHGRSVPYYTLVAPVLQGDEVHSIVLLATDVSHVVDAHRALQASEAMLRFVLETSGMGIWKHDVELGDTHWDATLAQLHGYEPAPRTVSRKEMRERIHPDDAPGVIGLSARMIENGGYRHEHRIVRVDGAVRWVSVTGQLQRRDDGRAFVIGGVVDITERKLQEEQLAQAQKLDSIGTLAGGIAHDFNNMLTAILAYADLSIAAAQAGKSPAVEDLREIKRAAERSRELTARLLAFARKHPVAHRVIDPNDVVHQLSRMLQRILGENIVLTTTLRATRNVRIDPNQLEQLLVNLVTNARDAMPRGGQLAIQTVDVAAASNDRAPAAHVQIRVTDTGVGIPPDVLEHVFEPFFTTKEPGRGTGLGLAQCYGIARQAAGRLRIESQPGAGTQVILELPAVDDVHAPEPTPTPTDLRGTETVLLVEDEPQVRQLAQRILAEHGYHVLAAHDGRHAVEVADAHAGEIHVLVTDMVMPGTTGIELARELKRTRPRTAVVVMSGYAPELDPQELAGHFVQKPFVGQELLAQVRAALTAR